MEPAQTPEVKLDSRQILYLDATSLRISSCDRNLYYNNVVGLRSPRDSIEIVFGKGFHIFAENMDALEGQDFYEILAQQKAKQYYMAATANGRVEIPDKKDYLDLNYLTEVCMRWTYQRPLDNITTLRSANSNRPMVEIKFAIPIYANEHVIIMLAGTIDKVAVQTQERWPYILDYKTSGQWNHDQYLNNYILDPQLRVYCWAIRWMFRHGQACGGEYSELVNALTSQAAFDTGVYGGQIYGVFLAATRKVTFKRSRMFIYKDADLDDFEFMLMQVAKRLATVYALGKDSVRTGIVNGACAGKFGYPCQYVGLCSAPDEETQNHLIKHNYKTTPYNPLKFGDLA